MTRVLQITDPHIVAPPAKMAGQVSTADRFSEAVRLITDNIAKFEGIDAIFVTGDLTDFGDLASYSLFREAVSSLKIPLFVIPGNHDNRETMRQAFRDLDHVPKSGRLNWVHEFEDFVLIGIDTLVSDESAGVIDDETLQFLTSAFASNPGKPVLLGMHHPPFESGVRFMDQIGLRGIPRLLDIVADAQVEVRIICGHLHCMNVCLVRGVVAISAPSTVSSIPADYRVNAPVGFTAQPGGFMLHDWTDGFRSTLVDLSGDFPLHPF